jgi:hypothetical protein
VAGRLASRSLGCWCDVAARNRGVVITYVVPHLEFDRLDAMWRVTDSS